MKNVLSIFYILFLTTNVFSKILPNQNNKNISALEFMNKINTSNNNEIVFRNSKITGGSVNFCDNTLNKKISIYNCVFEDKIIMRDFVFKNDLNFIEAPLNWIANRKARVKPISKRARLCFILEYLLASL